MTSMKRSRQTGLCRDQIQKVATTDCLWFAGNHILTEDDLKGLYLRICQAPAQGQKVR